MQTFDKLVIEHLFLDFFTTSRGTETFCNWKLLDKIALNCQKVAKIKIKKTHSVQNLTKIYVARFALQKHEKNVILSLFLVFSAENSLLLYPHRPEQSVWNKSEYWNPFTRLCQMYEISYNYALRKKTSNFACKFLINWS